MQYIIMTLHNRV